MKQKWSRIRNCKVEEDGMLNMAEMEGMAMDKGRGRVKKGEKDDRRRVMKGRKAGIRFSSSLPRNVLLCRDP